ncbi:MAG: hypothetical protein LBU39_04605 [Desulfobulbaceae bacterium]|jgi:hypothetical protein|nr:hypothetical protein [Desulfobulbaceae bacterium]
MKYSTPFRPLSPGAMRLVFYVAALMVLSACSPEKSETPATASVGNFRLSAEEFAHLLNFEAKVNPAFQLTSQGRGDFLRQLIEKQVLIQEARARHLDEKELFRQTIQRYWESTLIRDLLNAQGEEIRKATVVTEEEIAAWYQARKEHFSDQPLAARHDDIRRIVEDEKVAAAIRLWLDDLRGKTGIIINDPELRRQVLDADASLKNATDIPAEVQ